MDDVTRAMSKGGGVLVNVQEGGVFQFFGGRMTSRGQCPRGGAPGVPPIQVQTPPPTWLAGYGPGYIYSAPPLYRHVWDYCQTGIIARVAL